ncbi:MFS transporter [Ureibacillus acetophenoni]|uniref:Predicted MFS family arabinose efflux permease n=1 Tax=Ureibacillus acetophenoni TaxID=614649 RepID=A0A285UKC6_9BACL|nr:MFS transporter [Ureibacillus acetophenoni]SOC41838.1 predicted MFS family arabinose efflux permease [Ureibacillus acetophenoni]
MKSTKYEFYLLIIPLVIVEFVRGAFIISYLPSLYINPIGISLAIVGVAVSIHFIGDTFANFIMGYIIENLGSNKVLHLSFVVMTLSLSVFIIWPNSFTLIISTLFTGITVCPIWIYLLTKAAGDKRGQRISIVYLGWLLGLGAGYVAMNYLIQFNIENLLWFLPSLTIIAWIVYTIVNTGNICVEKVDIKKQWGITKELVISSKVVVPGILFQGIGMGMLIPILPVFAMQDLHLSTNQYTLIILIGGASLVLALIPLGKLVDNVKNKIILCIIGFIIFASALFALGSKPNLVVTIMVVIVLGVFYALFLPAWNSFIAGYIPESLKAVGWGIFSSLQGLGVMIGPAIGGVLAESYQTMTTIQGSAVIFGIAAIFYFFYAIRKQKQNLKTDG